MAFEDGGKTPVEPEVVIQQIRITLTNHNVKSLEVCTDLIRGTKDKPSRTVWIPSKTLRITTKKILCGEGSKTWCSFQMRIRKQLIDLHSPSAIVKQMLSSIEPGVETEVIIADT